MPRPPLFASGLQSPSQANHCHGCLCRFAPLIANVTARSVDSLLHCIAGKQAKRDRFLRLHHEIHQGIANRPVDVLIVGRFSTNNRT
jgi:hypothetical protein